MAKEFAVKYLGVSDSISINLSATYDKAKTEIDQKITKVRN